MHADQIAFVTDNTELAQVAFVPEIRLRQAEEPIGLWELSEGEYHSDQPPPFWAFAWAGGQALARYVLDHPETVAGRRVLDVATGSGLVAIAAARAGAAHVRAVDIDPLAVTAVECNARANGVSVEGVVADVLGAERSGASPGVRPAEPDPPTGAVGFDVVLAGDAFYSKAMSDRMTGFLRRVARHGAHVLAGDPERKFLRRELFQLAAVYEVPVPRVLEGVRVRRTSVWELSGRSGQPEREGR